MLDAKQICELLKIDQKRLRSWIREGLPVAKSRPKRLFDEDDVVAWLTEQGYAQPAPPPQTIAHTQAEAAALLGVSVRTLAAWSKLPGFPGQQGRPGQQTGHFPIEKIREWHAERTGGDGTEGESAADSPKAAWMTARAMLAQLEVNERLELLAEIKPLVQLVERQITVATTYLDDLPDLVLSRLPAGVNRKTRALIRQAVEEETRKAREEIAESLEGDLDETDEGEE